MTTSAVASSCTHAQFQAGATLPGHVDYFALWREWLESAGDPRLNAARDLEFWQGAAPAYHVQEGDPRRCPGVISHVLQQLRPGDTLLDAGCGAGRFALAAASQCAHVTAIDHSPAMLAAAFGHAQSACHSNITFLEGDISSANLTAHDVVLAAWSLYRCLDLQAVLACLVAATRRSLIIVAPDSDCLEQEPAAYLYILGALRQLGLRASLQVFEEPGSERDNVAVPVITWHRPGAST